MTDRHSYPRTLVVLHWLIVALIIGQFVSADGMEDFFRDADDSGMAPGLPGSGTALAHAAFGATILVLVIARFIVRMMTDVPPPPRDLNPLLRLAARLTHYGLYAALVLTPLSGAAAILITPEAGDAHEILKNVLLALAAAHVAGALTHLLVLRDGVFWRMLPVGRR
jgi:cytochrome b561